MDQRGRAGGRAMRRQLRRRWRHTTPQSFGACWRPCCRCCTCIEGRLGWMEKEKGIAGPTGAYAAGALSIQRCSCSSCLAVSVGRGRQAGGEGATHVPTAGSGCGQPACRCTLCGLRIHWPPPAKYLSSQKELRSLLTPTQPPCSRTQMPAPLLRCCWSAMAHQTVWRCYRPGQRLTPAAGPGMSPAWCSRRGSC